MASKSKKQRSKKENPTSLVLLSFAVGILALLQNRYGLFSDIYGFYGLHFSDGLHQWPFSEKTNTEDLAPRHPVEYPAVTGLIMWLISFLITPSYPDIYSAFHSYYRATAFLNSILFAVSSYLIYKMVGKKYTLYFVLAPAVLYSLNRNWDIWAVVTMLFAIYLYDKKKYDLSAFLLAISIATKFFPLVLMLPILIIFLKNKQPKLFIRYVLITATSWVAINLPFILINYEGWAYFYKFSAERGLGSASFYEITNIILPSITFSSIHFYFLNFFVLAAVTAYLLRLKTVPTLAATSFFVMFGFILFNKQYSFQYVIWLSALALLSFSYLITRHRNLLIYLYVFWQASELAFQYSFFQRILTGRYANTDYPLTITISDTTYGYVGVVRYILALIFAMLTAKFFFVANSQSAQSTENVKSMQPNS